MYHEQTGERMVKGQPVRNAMLFRGIGTTERQKAAETKNKALARSSGYALEALLKKRKARKKKASKRAD